MPQNHWKCIEMLNNTEMTEISPHAPISNHRWSGWPGAWCLDCGLEDADELDLAGHWSEVGHRYSGKPHTSQPCAGCSNRPCAMPGARLFDPYSLTPSL